MMMRWVGAAQLSTAGSWLTMWVVAAPVRTNSMTKNSCPTSPRTVTGLFDLITQLDSTAETIFCAPRGCECTEVRYIYASYDQQMGFPQTIRLRRDRQRLQLVYGGLDGLAETVQSAFAHRRGGFQHRSRSEVRTLPSSLPQRR